MDQKTYDTGMKMRRQVAGTEYVDKAMANLDDFNRDFQRIVAILLGRGLGRRHTSAARARSSISA